MLYFDTFIPSICHGRSVAGSFVPVISPDRGSHSQGPLPPTPLLDPMAMLWSHFPFGLWASGIHSCLLQNVFDLTCKCHMQTPSDAAEKDSSDLCLLVYVCVLGVCNGTGKDLVASVRSLSVGKIVESETTPTPRSQRPLAAYPQSYVKIDRVDVWKVYVFLSSFFSSSFATTLQLYQFSCPKGFVYACCGHRRDAARWRTPTWGPRVLLPTPKNWESENPFPEPFSG